PFDWNRGALGLVGIRRGLGLGIGRGAAQLVERALRQVRVGAHGTRDLDVASGAPEDRESEEYKEGLSPSLRKHGPHSNGCGPACHASGGPRLNAPHAESRSVRTVIHHTSSL